MATLTDESEDQAALKFCQDSVYLQVPESDRKDPQTLLGQLRVTERNGSPTVEWHLSKTESKQTVPDKEQADHEWAVITPSVNYKAEGHNKTGSSSPQIEIKSKIVLNNRNYERPIIIDTQDLGYIKVHGKKWNLLTLIQKDGTTHPVLQYSRGDINNFFSALEPYVFLKQLVMKKEDIPAVRSCKNAGSFRVLDLAAKDLERSFNELNIFGEQTSDFVSRFVNDPYSTTLGSFSKVTNFLYDYVVSAGQDSLENSRNEQEMADILHTSLSGVEINHNAESGFEVITCVEDLGKKPIVYRLKPVSYDDWMSYFNEEGHCTDEQRLKERIFHGGLSSSARCIGWKFLLHYYSFNSTSKSRQETLKKKKDDYYRMKLQWKSISEDQESRFTDLREKRNLVEKDVSRTDRTRSFYVGDNNPNVQMLFDVLMTYCMYNFDLGYVQGMSDLLSPILVVMEDEVDAFWCFVGFMNRVAHNFEMEQQGMKNQLKQLHTLLHFSNATLSDYLESHESGNLYFCFRWLLIIFKREFDFCDIMRLWEVMWTDLPCKNFHLLCCLAILDDSKAALMENHFGFTEILKYINDLSHHINLEETLCNAESIFLQLKACKHTPNNIREILGLPLLTPVKQLDESSLISQLDSSVETSSIEVLPEDSSASTSINGVHCNGNET
ncbi:TBC1 domain family member 15 [Nymphon striatum]|nr:TBC1 domain family member 15 [Nymphon striatum]